MPKRPTGTTMLLTGVMSKMGVYGFLRILLPIFPEQMHWLLTPLLVAGRDHDCLFRERRVCTKGSEAHLRLFLNQPPRLLPAGLVCRRNSVRRSGRRQHGKGCGAQRRVAANVQSRPHCGHAVLVCGHDRTAERRPCAVWTTSAACAKLRRCSCGLMGIALFSSLGLPGLNGFVGEFLIFKGVFPLAPWAAVRFGDRAAGDGDFHPDHSATRVQRTAEPEMGEAAAT